MQIVIEIPNFEWLENEEDFKEAVKEYEQGTRFDKEIRNALINGTPLPKHGRLIDADELKSMSYEVLVDTDNPNRADGLSAVNGLVEDDIDLAPTIIEADEESEEYMRDATAEERKSISEVKEYYEILRKKRN